MSAVASAAVRPPVKKPGKSLFSNPLVRAVISIAVFIESLVTVVRVSKQDVEKMLYPNLLLFTAILIVVGLGVYQRLSAAIEPRDERRSPDAETG